MSFTFLKATLTIAAASALSLSASAEVTAKISEVHLCCRGCANGVQKAVQPVEGAKATVDMDAGTVQLSGPDTATVQKAADALVKAGYFGKAEGVKLQADTGAKDQKVQLLHVEGVHLCCGKCVKAVDGALKSIPGAKEHNAVKGAKSFDVTGDFNDKDFFGALEKQGLTGHVAK